MEESSLHPLRSDAVGEKPVAARDAVKEKSDKSPQSSTDTAIDPNKRFHLINTLKDDGNFLFREKKYEEALERYIEAMVQLTVYRNHWRASRMRKLGPPVSMPAVASSPSLPPCSPKKDKGKDKMLYDDEEECQSAAAGCTTDTDTIAVSRGMVLMPTPSVSCIPLSSTTVLNAQPVLRLVDFDGSRRKRRRIDEAECMGGAAAASTDDMTVEIIDKSVYAMPQNMGCLIPPLPSSGTSSSSSSSSSSSTTTTSTSALPAAIEAVVVTPEGMEQSDWQSPRSFAALSECEKNLKRLEIILRLNVAACGIRLGRGAQALEQCRKVIRINDLECCEPLLYAKALFRKAQSLKILGMNKEACACLRLAVNFSPTDRAIRNELATLEPTEKKGSIVCQFFERLRCRKKQASAESSPVQSPPSPPGEASPKSNKCKFFSGLFGGSICPSRTALALLYRREMSHRGFTPQQKANVAAGLLPRETPIVVDKYGRRAYGGKWSGDGELLFTTCQDWKIRIYANDSIGLSQKCVVKTRKGQWTITDALMSSDKSFILYSSLTPHVNMVQLPRDLCNFSSQANEHERLNLVGAQGSDYSGIWSMALSSDDREVVAGTSDSSVCVYDLEKHQLVERAAAHGDDVNAVCYVESDSDAGPSSCLLASGSDDGLIFIWDKRCMSYPVGTLFGHTEGLTCLTSKGDGRYLLSNAKDQTMKLWDLRRMVGRHSAQPPVKKYAWDYRGMTYPGNPDTDRHPCDLSVSTFRGHSVLRTLVRCIFSPPSWSGQRYACTASVDGKVYIFDLASSLLVRVYNTLPGQEVPVGSSSAVVRDLSWHPYLPYLVTSSWDGGITLFAHENGPRTSCDSDLQTNDEEGVAMSVDRASGQHDTTQM